MKKLLIVLLVWCVGFAYAQEKLTNASVVEMIELGLDKEVVLEKINASTTAFDTSIEALKTLKAQGVPSEVLAAMVKAGKPAAAKAKTGIYALVDAVEVPILPTVFSGSKTHTLAAFFTSGIASAKITSTLHGVRARNSFKNPVGSFLFYFDPSEQTELKTTSWWFQTAASPNEFALIRLEVDEKRACRTIETGSVNRYAGASAGVNNTTVRAFEIAQEGPGVFRVTPNEPLEPGEYCFYYQGAIPQGGVNNQSVFDFSIEAPQVQPVHAAFVPEVGYITRGVAADGLPLPEGLLYVGTLGGAKGVYLAPRSDPEDQMEIWGEGSAPTREQLRKLLRSQVVVDNSSYAFTSNYYWSSTESDEDEGWLVQAPSGEAKILPKLVRAYVRHIWEY